VGAELSNVRSGGPRHPIQIESMSTTGKDRGSQKISKESPGFVVRAASCNCPAGGRSRQNFLGFFFRTAKWIRRSIEAKFDGVRDRSRGGGMVAPSTAGRSQPDGAAAPKEGTKKKPSCHRGMPGRPRRRRDRHGADRKESVDLESRRGSREAIGSRAS